MSNPLPIIFFDIDNTLTQPVSGNDFGATPTDFEPKPNVLKKLEQLKYTYYLVGISNQGGVAAGYKTVDECHQEQLFKLDILRQLVGIFYCTDNEGCYCYAVDRLYSRTQKPSVVTISERHGLYTQLIGMYRKPNPGMLKAAKLFYGVKDTPLVLMVGDRREDYLAAKNMGIAFELSSTYFGMEQNQALDQQ